MSFKHQLEGDTAIFTWIGQLSPEEQSEIRKLFWEDFALKSAAQVVVDLSQSDLFDASAISLLVGAKNLATKEKAKLNLVALQDDNVALLKELNLFAYFDLQEESQETPSS